MNRPALAASIRSTPPTRHDGCPRRATGAWWRVVVALMLGATIALVGCSSSDSTDDAGSVVEPDAPDDPVTDEQADNSDPTAPPSMEGEDDEGDEPLERSGIDGDFGEVAATITAADGETCELCLLYADTPDLRSQGLMRVTDPELGGYDGMLFDHGNPSPGAYWMKDTPMPLSIAYWDESGAFVSSVDMEPCVEDQPGSCPTYPADGPFRFALEVTEGGLEEILAVEGSTLTVDGTECPAAAT